MFFCDACSCCIEELKDSSAKQVDVHPFSVRNEKKTPVFPGSLLLRMFQTVHTEPRFFIELRYNIVFVGGSNDPIVSANYAGALIENRYQHNTVIVDPGSLPHCPRWRHVFSLALFLGSDWFFLCSQMHRCVFAVHRLPVQHQGGVS